MNVTHVKASFGATVNLGNFNSARFDVELAAQLIPREDPVGAIQQLHELAKGEVKRQAEASKRSREPQWSGEYPG